MATTEVKFGPLTGAATITGVCLGAIFDIVVFHHILQLHQMLSSKIGSETLLRLKVNIFWDGIFLLLTLVLLVVGIVSLWKVLENPFTPRSSRVFYGGLLMGWGLYVTLEGIVNHILLEIHHVIEVGSTDQKLFWDVASIVIGVLIIWGGRLIISHGKKNFFKHEVQKSRRRKFKFRPAFNRQTVPKIKVAGIHRSVRASSNLH